MNETQVKEKLLPFIGGSSAIGGVIHVTNGQIYSFSEAAELRLVKRSIAIEMLQAQVATGGVVNPKNGQVCDLRNAIQTNLVPNEFDMHLQEAEKAFKGFVMAGYSGPVPLVEAIRVGIVAEMQGTRLLDAQCNTGGLVDPAFGYRVPLEVAKDKGLIDPRVAGLLNPQTSEQKAYTDPNTGKHRIQASTDFIAVAHASYFPIMKMIIFRLKSFRKFRHFYYLTVIINKSW